MLPVTPTMVMPPFDGAQIEIVLARHVDAIADRPRIRGAGCRVRSHRRGRRRPAPAPGRRAHARARLRGPRPRTMARTRISLRSHPSTTMPPFWPASTFNAPAGMVESRTSQCCSYSSLPQLLRCGRDRRRCRPACRRSARRGCCGRRRSAIVAVQPRHLAAESAARTCASTRARTWRAMWRRGGRRCVAPVGGALGGADLRSHWRSTSAAGARRCAAPGRGRARRGR